ncbi:phosphocholine cytidylyltransferase family protein [uncultured Odoribacter sp.]|uniref:phosphocholine cytidylyltransferase family protein n=1 Tax=uncultured Odoribacter sp. TaxID=876416 RepID=UPI0026342B27|nr:phosphocholine cytidylyltransferase family protein [uncultured Odoribacter sp.]
MKAVILAAGIASRLRPLTDHTPKCLLEIGGKSLLERAIQGLLANNIRELILVTGYLQEQIVTFVQKKFPELEVKFIHNEKYASTNNIYSLWLVKNSIKEENIVLLDSDILFDPGLVKAVIDSPYPDTLALNSHPLCEEEMKVIADSTGKVTEISKTCPPTQAIGESIGIEKISNAYLKLLFQELDQMIVDEKLGNVFYEAAFQRLIAKGKSFHIVDTSALFSMELDTQEDFQAATEKLPANLL